MIWLAWRQFRTPVAVAVVLLVAIAIVTALTGPHLVHLYDTTVTNCTKYSDCSSAETLFLRNDHFLQAVLPPVLLGAPALIGVFWGAPLVARELETGTFKLSWSQSVTRVRWLAVKLGLIGLASMAATGLLSLIVSWWFSPIDQVNLNRFTPSVFGVRSIAPIGYAAFAFVLGVVLGAVIRKTLPTMAATIVGFLGVRLAMTYWIRPHLATPLGVSSPLQLPLGNGPGPVPGAGTIQPGSWILSETTINRNGQVIGQSGGIGPNGELGLQVSANGTVSIRGVGMCPGVTVPSVGSSRVPSAQSGFDTCARHFGLRDVVTYQPASRFWAFQWYEMAIFIGLAVVLAAFCFYWVRRRLT